MDHVIAGYDGSPHAEAAVRWAAEEACLHHAPLRVVTAADTRVTPAADLRTRLGPKIEEIAGDQPRRAPRRGR